MQIKGSKLVFANPAKLKRAQVILALVKGTVYPKKDEELERKEKFTALLAEGGVNLEKEADAVEFIYETLGGLVRTEAEQARAEKTAAEMKAKGKKKQFE